MSNGVVQSVNDANERSRQNLQPYQSLWLAHWKRAETDCCAAGEASSPNASGNEELDCMSRRDGLSKGLEASSRYPNGLRVKNGMLEIGNDFIEAGRKRVGNESSEAVDSRSGSPPSGCHSVEEDTSENPPKLIRTCSARNRKDSLFRLTPLQDKFVDSLPRSFPYKFDVELDKFDKGKDAVSVSPRKRSFDMRMLEHEHRQTDFPAGFPMFSQSSNDMNAPKVDVKASKVTIRSELSTEKENKSKKNLHSVSNWTSSAKVKCNVSLDEYPNADGGNRSDG